MFNIGLARTAGKFRTRAAQGLVGI